MSQIKNTEIEGSVAIGRHVTAGGDATVRGSARIRRNLRVDGWLDAPNIKGVSKGLFPTPDALEERYPHPEPGWWALVGDGLPASLYVSDGDGWRDTGKSAGEPTIDSQIYETSLNELRDQTDRLEESLAAVEKSVEDSAGKVTAAQDTAESALEKAQEALARLREALEIDTTDAIDNLREVLAFLEGIKDDESLAATLTGVEEVILEIVGRLDRLDSGKVDKVDGLGLSECSFTEEEKRKLAGLETAECGFTAEYREKLDGLRNYEHPATHPASMIVEDATHRFVSDEILSRIISTGPVCFFNGVVSDESEAYGRYGIFLVMPAGDDGICYFTGDFGAMGLREADYNFEVPHARVKVVSPKSLFVLNEDGVDDAAGVYFGIGYTGRVVKAGGGSGDGPGCTCEGLTQWQKSWLAQQEESDRQGKFYVGLVGSGVGQEYTGTALNALLQATVMFDGKRVDGTITGTTANLEGVTFGAGGSASAPLSVPAASTGRVADVFTIRGDWDDGNGVLSKTASVTFTRYAPMRFLSKSGTDAPTPEEITAAAQKQVKGSIAGTYQIELTPGEYVWVCVPSFLTAGGFTSGGFAVPMEAAVSVAVKIGGTTVTYRCHRTSGAPTKSPMSLTIT